MESINGDQKGLVLTLTRRWDFFGPPWDEGNIGWVRWRGVSGGRGGRVGGEGRLVDGG